MSAPSAHPPPRAARLQPWLGAAMVAVIVVTVLAGGASLRKTFSPAGESAAALVEQKRLLDFLALDLRRAVTPPMPDADEEGIQIVVPDVYHFAPGDLQHRFPLPADPDSPAAGTQKITYRYFNDSITRTDPWLPLVRGEGGYVSSGPVTVASDMADFPTIRVEHDAAGASVRYRITVHSIFRSDAEDDAAAVTITVPAAR